VFTDLFGALPVSTRLTVLTQAGAQDALAGVLASSGVTDRTSVIVAPEDMGDFTVWAQDPFLVVGDHLVQPAEFEHDGDDAIAPLLGMRVERSPLHFQGGDVLVGDDFALVGRGCSDGLEELLGCRVVKVGTDLPVPSETNRALADGRIEVVHQAVGRAAPLAHLDLFITLAGGRRLLVGSPGLADDVLGRPPVDHALSPLFDDIAQQLLDEGFEVIRNPLPLTYGDGRRLVEGRPERVRLWYFATANNCLVGDGHVWLPAYGYGAWPELAATDEANRRIWEGLGFATHQVSGLHPFAQRLGALRCITKVLEH
jgi:hypothetical protein